MYTIWQIIKPYDRLLGKQKVGKGHKLRLMNFVVRQPVDGGLLLFHTMTKAMVWLSHEEAELLDSHPESMIGLAESWFLVPETHDDRLLSRQMRRVGQMLAKPVKGITTYTIFTTTACNARCFYCFQKDGSRTTMTEATAQHVADYIIRHSKGQGVMIHWFGGEPLYNKSVITQVSRLLADAGVFYHSTMISNGFLFDDETISEAKELWKLKRVQITLDGTEKMYNRIKAYIYKDVNAYRQVIANIHHLLDAGLQVKIRLNIDRHNADDLYQLADDLSQEFGSHARLNVYLHTLYGEVAKNAAFTIDNQRMLLFEKIRMIKARLKEHGLLTPPKLSRRVLLRHCIADSDSSVDILPDGRLGKCDYYMDSEFIGHIDSEEMDDAVINSFKEQFEEIDACATCAFYPNCIRLRKCSSAQYCFPEVRQEKLESIREGMLAVYGKYKKREG